eukprot:980828-Pelagomonas_calceolata.AAC.3
MACPLQGYKVAMGFDLQPGYQKSRQRALKFKLDTVNLGESQKQSYWGSGGCPPCSWTPGPSLSCSPPPCAQDPSPEGTFLLQLSCPCRQEQLCNPILSQFVIDSVCHTDLDDVQGHLVVPVWVSQAVVSEPRSSAGMLGKSYKQCNAWVFPDGTGSPARHQSRPDALFVRPTPGRQAHLDPVKIPPQDRDIHHVELKFCPDTDPYITFERAATQHSHTITRLKTHSSRNPNRNNKMTLHIILIGVAGTIHN